MFLKGEKYYMTLSWSNIIFNSQFLMDDRAAIIVLNLQKVKERLKKVISFP